MIANSSFHDIDRKTRHSSTLVTSTSATSTCRTLISTPVAPRYRATPTTLMPMTLTLAAVAFVLTEVKVSTRNCLENLRQTPNANTTVRNEKFISKGKLFQQKQNTKTERRNTNRNKRNTNRKLNKLIKKTQKEKTIIAQKRKLKLIALLSLKNGPKSTQ
jgi:hypothetical protein